MAIASLTGKAPPRRETPTTLETRDRRVLSHHDAHHVLGTGKIQVLGTILST